MWCGCEECADEIGKVPDVSVPGDDIRLEYIEKAERKCIICGRPAKQAVVGRSY